MRQVAQNVRPVGVGATVIFRKIHDTFLHELWTLSVLKGVVFEIFFKIRRESAAKTDFFFGDTSLGFLKKKCFKKCRVLHSAAPTRQTDEKTRKKCVFASFRKFFKNRVFTSETK